MWYWILGSVIVVLLIVIGVLIVAVRGLCDITEGFIKSFWR